MTPVSVEHPKTLDCVQRSVEIAKKRGVKMATREGGAHTQVRIGESVTYVPRHAEINEITAKAIMKQIGEGK